MSAEYFLHATCLYMQQRYKMTKMADKNSEERMDRYIELRFEFFPK